MDNLKNDLNDVISRVRKFTSSVLEGQPIRLYAAASTYLTSGGKKLRPFMVIKSCEMFAGKEEKALPAAAAVELIHNFSLIHDDIMDNDDMRHGISTVHKEYGLPIALIAGDILFSKAFQVLSVHNKKMGHDDVVIAEMNRILATACVHVCEGQGLDIQMASSNKIPTIEEYLDMIQKKTASLFEVSCALGVLSSPEPLVDNVDNLSKFGRFTGIAFQLIDDLIGVTGDPKLTGKAVGNDIREGKKTYPILLALSNADTNKRKKIMRAFGSKGANRDYVEDAVYAISSLKIEEEVRRSAHDNMMKAFESIKSYDETNAKNALVSSAKFIVERSL
ncbi:MAG: polyprenyl synthetase family protein [Thaumarchaeota archaeon]|nr:MAG: polyprenyl synthetase family protein [Nitrososphaerota archaeon]